MSMPSIILKCDKCDYSSSDMVLWGPLLYLIDGREISMNRQLGWCHECRGLKPIEHFKPDEYLAKIKECQEELNKLQSKPFRLFFSISKRYRAKYYREDIEEQSLVLHISSKRQGTEKCLACSSDKVVPFDGDYSLEYDGAALYLGEKRTGFQHPECGGEFIATPNPIRFNVAFTPKHYDINGIRI